MSISPCLVIPTAAPCPVPAAPRECGLFPRRAHRRAQVRLLALAWFPRRPPSVYSPCRRVISLCVYAGDTPLCRSRWSGRAGAGGAPSCATRRCSSARPRRSGSPSRPPRECLPSSPWRYLKVPFPVQFAPTETHEPYPGSESVRAFACESCKLRNCWCQIVSCAILS